MEHLGTEEIAAAARAAADADASRAQTGRPGDAARAERAAAHLAQCPACADEVAGLGRVASVLRAEAPEPEVPPFDALMAPVLRSEAAPAAGRGRPRAAEAARLAAAVIAGQARRIPWPVWPITGTGFALLAAATWSAGSLAAGAMLFGPGVTLLTVFAALSATPAGRGPQAELAHTLQVPPVAVWLSRLAVLLAAVLGSAAALSALWASAAGAPQATAAVIGGWLGPALLCASIGVFGTVWRSPAVGAVFGVAAWAAGIAATRTASAPVPGALRDTLDALWTTTPVSLALSAAVLTAAAWLVARSDRATG